MGIQDFKGYKAFDSHARQRAMTIYTWVDFIHSIKDQTYVDLSGNIKSVAKTQGIGPAWEMFQHREDLVLHRPAEHSAGLFPMRKKVRDYRQYSILDENPLHTLRFVEYVINEKLKELSSTAESRLQCHFEIISHQDMVEQVANKTWEAFTDSINRVLLITKQKEWGIFVSSGTIENCLLFLPCDWDIPGGISELRPLGLIHCYQGGSDYRIAAVSLWIQNLKLSVSALFFLLGSYSVENAQQNFSGIQEDVNIFLQAYEQELESHQLLGLSDQPESWKGEAKLTP